MGVVTRAMVLSAEASGAVVRLDAEVAKILTRESRVTGVALKNGDELEAGTVLATCHPQHTFLRFLEEKELPGDFVGAIRSWRSRSGTVKVNLAVDRLPAFKGRPAFSPEVHGGTIVLAESLDELEGAFQDAVAGRASARPFADICIPSVFDRTLAPEG